MNTTLSVELLISYSKKNPRRGHSLDNKQSVIDFFKASQLSIGEKQIRANGASVDYSFKQGKVKGSKNEYYCLFQIWKSQNNKVEQSLEKLSALRSVVIQTIETLSDVVIIEIKNDASAFYAERAYPLIYEVENLMRQLIFKTLVINIGASNFIKKIPNKIKNTKKFQELKEKPENTQVANSLFHLDFIHLSQVLFTEESEKSIDMMLEKIKKAEKSEDLDIKDLKALIPKSNWERFFDFVKIKNLKEKWSRLYSYRNDIAHNKLITREDFKNIKRITSELNKGISQAIKQIIKEPKIVGDDFKDFAKEVVDYSSFYENLGKPQKVFGVFDLINQSNKALQQALSISSNPLDTHLKAYHKAQLFYQNPLHDHLNTYQKVLSIYQNPTNILKNKFAEFGVSSRMPSSFARFSDTGSHFEEEE